MGINFEIIYAAIGVSLCALIVIAWYLPPFIAYAFRHWREWRVDLIVWFDFARADYDRNMKETRRLLRGRRKGP